MTSMPASRSARAMIFAPRSCPSRPGLATTTRIFPLDPDSTAGGRLPRVRARTLLALVTVIALVVRIAGAGDRLSADEGYSWLVGSAGSWGVMLDRLAAYQNTPPLYYL